ncbi:MAG: hypothetical protein HY064_01965, partial [Bacteroidetes bacterium]|nr:hypothetical protein [Bacteroidota bacterium]
AIVEEGNYVNSSRTGVWTSYYPSGGKKSEMTYVNNRPNGHAVFYNEKGHKSEEGTWKATHWIGDYKMFYTNDSVRQAFHYNSQGKRDGANYMYWPNGRLWTSVTYIDGKENDWVYEFDSTGRMLSEFFYTDGQEDISQRKIFPGSYHEDHPGYNYSTDHECIDCHVAIVVNMKDSSDNGKISDPKPDSSIVINQWPNGKVKRETLFVNGNSTGNFTEFDEKGNQTGIFKNYRLIDGEEYCYDSKGKLMRIALYKNGKYVGEAPLPEKENR